LFGVDQVVVFGLDFFAGVDVGNAAACKVDVDVDEPGVWVRFVVAKSCVEVFAPRAL
jgi:hypothetical protein